MLRFDTSLAFSLSLSLLVCRLTLDCPRLGGVTVDVVEPTPGQPLAAHDHGGI